MTQKSPEEYFQQMSFGTGDGADGGTGGGQGFTPAERAFMQKYLGVDESDILRKIGITPPAPEETPVEAAAVESPAPEVAPVETVQDEAVQDEAVPAEDIPAPLEAEEVEPAAEEIPAASEAVAEAEPEAEPEVKTDAAPQAAPEPDPVAPVAQPEPQPAPVAPAAPAAAPAPAAPVPHAVAAKPSELFEPEEPSLEQLMKEAEEQQLVAFFLGEQEFVLPIMAVQEVIKAMPFARLPSAPPLVAGVINLRGRVTPLLQLRELLDVPRHAKHNDSFIIVCRRRGMQMGLIIDKVHTMYRVRQKDVDWQVESHLGNIEVVSGLMKAGDRLLGIISVDKIFDLLLEA